MRALVVLEYTDVTVAKDNEGLWQHLLSQAGHRASVEHRLSSLARALSVLFGLLPLLNASLAFTLNATTSLLVQEGSALVFIVVGLVMDVFIVVCGSAIWGEGAVHQQHMGLLICMSVVFFWYS